MPRAVHSRGVVENGAVVHLTTQYLYDTPNLAVSCVSGALSQAGRPFAHGFEFYLDEATLAFEFANLGGQGHVAMPLSVILPDGTVTRPELGIRRSGRRIRPGAHGRRRGRRPQAGPQPRLSGELARQALRLCLAEIESVRTGAVVDTVVIPAWDRAPCPPAFGGRSAHGSVS